MRFSQLCLGALIVGCVAIEEACGGGCILCPSPTGPFPVRGEVLDDSLDLPPDSRVRITLEGVRVEVLDGPDRGKVAISDPVGRFDLGPVTLAVGHSGAKIPTRLRASKDGWLSKERQVLDAFFSEPQFRLSQAPHVVWGCFTIGESGAGLSTPHVGVRVQIVDGPAAGGVAFSDNNGYFRFDDLATQPQFSFDASKAGYQTTRYPIYSAVEGNQSVNTGACLTLRPE